MIQWQRGFRTLRHASKSLVNAPAHACDRVAISAEKLREQLPNLPPDHRVLVQKYLIDKPQDLHINLETCAPRSKAKSEDLVNLISIILATASDTSSFNGFFWQAVKDLARFGDAKHSDLFATLFEVAKSMPTERSRARCKNLVGSQIYKLRQYRLDPVNEVEYLDALVAMGKPFRALSIWKSRANRAEVQRSILWPEVGALYYLEAGLWHPAERLARALETESKLTPRLCAQLVRFAAGKRSVTTHLGYWVQCLVKLIELHGLSSTLPEADTLEQHMNSIQPLSVESGLKVLWKLILTGQWNSAKSLLPVLDNHVELPQLLKMLGASGKATVNRFESNAVPFFSDLLNRWPVLLTRPELYTAWIASLSRQKRTAELKDVLSILQSNHIQMDDRQLRRLVYVLLQTIGYEHTSELIRNSQFDTSSTAALIGRYVNKREPAAAAEFFKNQHVSMTPPLALEHLNAGNPANIPLNELTLDSNCWRACWILQATAKSEDLGQLFVAFARSNAEPTIQLLASVIQAFLTNGKPIHAAAVLSFAQKEYKMRISDILAISVLHTAHAVQHGLLPKGRVTRSNCIPLGVCFRKSLDWKPVARKLLAIHGVDVRAGLQEAESISVLWQSDIAPSAPVTSI